MSKQYHDLDSIPYETIRSATDLFYEKQTPCRLFYRLQSLFSVCADTTALIICKDVFLLMRTR